jgi:hypothetical protein
MLRKRLRETLKEWLRETLKEWLRERRLRDIYIEIFVTY